MVSPQDLEAVSQSLARSTKPKLSALNSLDKAARVANFGVPNTDISEKFPASSNETPLRINLVSPTIKKRLDKAPQEEKKLVQEAQIDKLISHGEFSSDAISFVPYGVGFLTAHEVLLKINGDPEQFTILQENYLTDTSLKFIIDKIDKVFDLDHNQKEQIRSFYLSILLKRQKKSTQIERVKAILSKIKSKTFRTQLGSEITRMIPNSGDLYNYYANFNLIDEEIKKMFMAKINQIDGYVLKKTKELLSFNQNDINRRYQEILDFSETLKVRNVLMDNFHSQVEHLLAQKKAAENLSFKCHDLIKTIKEIAFDFSRKGKYGLSISRSSEIMNKIKTIYFVNIQQVIEPVITRLQKTVFDLEMGNYTDLESINQRIVVVDPTKIQTECSKIFDKFSKQKI